MSLLLLAGTSEARQIAVALADSGPKVIASLAGVTRNPPDLPVPTRTGGFGGETGFRVFLDQNGVTAVIDATHPFAARITDRTARVCAEMGLPYLLFRRPAWMPGEGDFWRSITREEDAAAHIPHGATVFLATGRQTLDRFANLEGRRVICRQIDPPTAAFPFEGGEFLIGRPPFSVARERETFSALGVDWLVVKNAGGRLSRSKLDAARDLGLPVLMLSRPPVPDGITVASTLEEALTWARSR